MKRKKLFKLMYGGLGTGVLFLFFVYSVNFYPKKLEPVTVHCPEETPSLQEGQTLKVFSWNVQFMAGTDKLFFFEAKPNQPYEKPSRRDIERTLPEVARVISEENPDTILLQEVDDGAARTFHEDQLARLLALLSSDYRCHASAFYWKSAFIPHPDIMGSAGMKLSIISKYKMTEAWRHQLALVPENFLKQQFDVKRAVLEVHQPVAGGRDLIVFDTHLSAFAHGTGTLEKQAARVFELLQEATLKGNPWVIGGDFNMLPPGVEGGNGLGGPSEQAAMKLFYDSFAVYPTLAMATGAEREKWFTSISKSKMDKKLNKSIDYLIFPHDLPLAEYRVRNETGMATISDHMPMVARFQIPDA